MVGDILQYERDTWCPDCEERCCIKHHVNIKQDDINCETNEVKNE